MLIEDLTWLSQFFFFMYHGLSKILGEICKNIFVFILASSQCLPYQLWQHILDTYSTKLCLFCDFLDNKRAEKTPFNEEKQNFPCRRHMSAIFLFSINPVMVE